MIGVLMGVGMLALLIAAIFFWQLTDHYRWLADFNDKRADFWKGECDKWEASSGRWHERSVRYLSELERRGSKDLPS